MKLTSRVLSSVHALFSAPLRLFREAAAASNCVTPSRGYVV